MILIYLCVLAASLTTLVGAWVFIKLNEKYPKTITVLTGLSAGFLLAIIFIGIIPESRELLENVLLEKTMWVLPLCVTIGTFLIIIFEKLLPVQHHHDITAQESVMHTREHVFYVTLIAFGLHSLFELISVIITGSANMTVGLLLGLVIGIHNIPIGFIIMAQLEAIGEKPMRIFKGIALLSLGETIIAIICSLLLSFILNDIVQGVMLALTAGVMLYLLFDELLPKIYQEEDQHHANYAILIGAMLMLLFLSIIGE